MRHTILSSHLPLTLSVNPVAQEDSARQTSPVSGWKHRPNSRVLERGENPPNTLFEPTGANRRDGEVDTALPCQLPFRRHTWLQRLAGLLVFHIYFDLRRCNAQIYHPIVGLTTSTSITTCQLSVHVTFYVDLFSPFVPRSP